MSMEQSTLGERRTPAVFITGAGGEVGHGLISSLSEDGKTDIVICDGFVGNTVLKLIEGLIKHLFTWINDSIQEKTSSKNV